jgi:hypothetical protein
VSRRWTTWLAWGLWLAALAICVGDVIVAHANGLSARTIATSDGFGITFGIFFPMAGALVASRRPENPLGWILLLAGLTEALEALAHRWAQHTLVVSPGSLPFGHLAAWLQSFIWIGGLLSLPLALALFPHGRLLSRRWRWIPAFAFVPIALFLVGAVQVWSYPSLQLLRDTQLSRVPAAMRLANSTFFLIPVAVVGAIVSAVIRFRRSSGEERAQLKWVTYAMALAGTEYLVSVGRDAHLYSFSPVFDLVAIPLVPTAIVVAILKYRLYDIDRIINRTLVYGALTALLAGVYVGIAVGLGSLVGSNASSLVIAGATLVVAALFRPARRAIQGLIDRRFYRRKYDAARTLEEFAARLRDEVDIGELESHLLDVVDATMQPAHVGLWLRPAEAGA